MSQKSPFSHSQRRIGVGLVQVEVQGHLDEASARDYLTQLKGTVTDVQRSDGCPVRLLFKDGLTGFDPGKVARLHGEWIRDLGPSVERVAIISQKATVRFGAAAARLVVRQPLEIFEDEKQARAWLQGD